MLLNALTNLAHALVIFSFVFALTIGPFNGAVVALRRGWKSHNREPYTWFLLAGVTWVIIFLTTPAVGTTTPAGYITSACFGGVWFSWVGVQAWRYGDEVLDRAFPHPNMERRGGFWLRAARKAVLKDLVTQVDLRKTKAYRGRGRDWFRLQLKMLLFLTADCEWEAKALYKQNFAR